MSTSKVEELKKRFNYTGSNKSKEAFEASQLDEQEKEEVKRLSHRPEVNGGMSIADIHREISGIELELVKILSEEGKLTSSITSLLGNRRLYDIKEIAHITAAKLMFWNKNKASQLAQEYATEKGKNLAELTDKLAEVFSEHYEQAEKAIDIARGLKEQNLEHRQYLERKLIGFLQEGKYKVADQTEAEFEVKKIEGEIQEIDGVLKKLEAEIKLAREAGEVETVKKLTGEAGEVLDMKYQVLNGQLSGEEQVSEIRRELLHSTKGVKVARQALVASEANYKAINAVIDAYTDIAILYEHNLDMMIPIMKETAATVGLQQDADKLKNTVRRAAELSERMIIASTELGQKVAQEAFQVLQEDTYDTQKLNKYIGRLDTAMAELNEAKKHWVEMNNSFEDANAAVEEVKPGAGYMKRR